MCMKHPRLWHLRWASARLGNVMSSMLGQNRVIAKDVKSFNYCCYVICVALIVRLGGMPLPQTGATHYHAQLRPPDKGRAIKGLVVCYVVWLWSMIYGIGLLRFARCVVWSLVVVRMAIKLKYRNTQWIHKGTYHISYTLLTFSFLY